MESKSGAANRLDTKVVLTMAIIGVIALIIFGFRVMTTPACGNIRMNIQGTNSIDSFHFYTGMPLQFSYNSDKKDKCEWSFGTKDNKKSEGQFVTFSYTEPGQYLIGLTVNGRCNEYQFITISKAPKLVDPSLIPTILCPIQVIEIGTPVVFRDSTPNAKSWEWRFGESAGVDATTQTAAYTFKSVGSKTVTLTINGNADAFATCQIYVNEKAAKVLKTGGDIVLPPIKDKPAEQEVTLTAEGFQELITKVAKGELMASACAQYLCGGNLQTPVKYKVTGSKEKNVSFEWVCKDLEEMKWKKIKEIIVVPNRNPVTGCFDRMDITVKKKTGIF